MNFGEDADIQTIAHCLQHGEHLEGGRNKNADTFQGTISTVKAMVHKNLN